MGCEDEVLRVGKKLEKMISSDTSDHVTALDLLKTLRDLPMTLDVLQKTRIGMTVNNFRKATSNDEVVSLAKTLIKNWKKLLPETNQGSNPELKKSNSTSSTTKMDESSNDGFDSSQSQSSLSSQSSFSKSAESSGSGDTFTNDPVRIKCRELIQGALKLPDTAEPLENALDPVQLSAEIEDAVFREFGNTESKYKTRIRSRMSNLRDAKNPQLRNNVLLGHIAPERLAKMTAEEMASDEMKKLRAKLTKEAIDDHQMAKTGGTCTDLIKCGKCGKNNCTYNQVQTRSADEPMTTFCFCNECGHRWKFC